MNLQTLKRTLPLLALSLLPLPALLVPLPAQSQTIIKQSNPQSRVAFLLLTSTTTSAGVTGLTGQAAGTAVNVTAGVAGSFTSIQYSRNGAAYVNCAGTISEIGKGLYAYTPTAGEANTTFDTVFVASAAGSFDALAQVAFSVYKTDDLGVTLGTPANGSVSADIAAANTGLGTLTTRIPGTIQPQTGDAFARIGAAGAGLTAIGDTRLGYLTGDAYIRLGAPAGASVSADLAALLTAQTSGFAAIPNTIFNYSIETGATPIHFIDWLRVSGAYFGGNTNGSNTFYALGDGTKTRITATINSTTKARSNSLNLVP